MLHPQNVYSRPQPTHESVATDGVSDDPWDQILDVDDVQLKGIFSSDEEDDGDAVRNEAEVEEEKKEDHQDSDVTGESPSGSRLRFFLHRRIELLPNDCIPLLEYCVGACDSLIRGPMASDLKTVDFLKKRLNDALCFLNLLATTAVVEPLDHKKSKGFGRLNV